MSDRIEQTQTLDDFEEACKKSGIEIVEVEPKKLEGTGVKATVENHIVKFVAQNRFIVVCKATYPKYAYSPFRIDSDFEMLKKSAEKIALAKSIEEVRDEVEWLLPYVIDMNGWHTPRVL